MDEGILVICIISILALFGCVSFIFISALKIFSMARNPFRIYMKDQTTSTIDLEEILSLVNPKKAVPRYRMSVTEPPPLPIKKYTSVELDSHPISKKYTPLEINSQPVSDQDMPSSSHSISKEKTPNTIYKHSIRNKSIEYADLHRTKKEYEEYIQLLPSSSSCGHTIQDSSL